MYMTKRLRKVVQLNPIIFRQISLTIPNMEKAMEDLQNNPYYDKYADRIASLQKTSPEEFLRRVEHQQSAKKENARKKFASVDTRSYSSALNPKEPRRGGVSAEDKKLDDILKINLVEDKEASEIQRIWEEYHKSREVISAVVPRERYASIETNARLYPTFVFPLPRAHGYEFIVCQTYSHAAHFTPLLAYQVHKENAPECLTMVHYTELADKGLVLMRGEYDKNVLSGKEAQCLANQFQMYYGGREPDKLRLLRTFTEDPDRFQYTELVEQLENIGLP